MVFQKRIGLVFQAGRTMWETQVIVLIAQVSQLQSGFP